QALVEVGEKKIPGAVLIPSGFAETGNVAGQEEVVAVARKYDIRLMGPNIYGFYYTPKNLCATFCTAYDFKGVTALSSQSGGNGRIYDDVFRQSGVIRASSLRDLQDFARAIPVLPTPKGNNVVIITGAGGSGVLLSDACVDNGLSLMAMPPDLDAAFRKFIPPFGAAGNPVDITGGEPPTTYQNTVRL